MRCDYDRENLDLIIADSLGSSRRGGEGHDGPLRLRPAADNCIS